MDVVRRKHLTQRALTDLEAVVLDVLHEAGTPLRAGVISNRIDIPVKNLFLSHIRWFMVFWSPLHVKVLSVSLCMIWATTHGGLQRRRLKVSLLNNLQIIR